MANKAIGPTFHDECVAAGVTDWRFSWGDDGTFSFNPLMTQQALVQQVYTAHDPTKLTRTIQMGQSFASGVSISSTSAPAINGTYGISAQAVSDIDGISNCIANTGKFPGGALTYSYQDQGGAWHSFPSTTVWTNFASTYAGYVSQWRQYALGLTASPPTAPAPIP